tara:strand:- start:3306 stop:4208 length:903 start_codon:yes stop_codon:yes gene_type:complete
MAEEEQQEVIASWDSAPEYGNDEKPVPVSEEEQIEAEESEPEVEEEAEAEAETDWEDRYKNLEQSHSRRGNELHSLKQEQDALRLEKLEMRQRMLELEQKVSDVGSSEKQASNKPDPLDDKTFWNDEEKEILKEYPELLGVAKKLAHKESQLALRTIDNSSQEQVSKETEGLKEEVDRLRDHVALEQAKAQLDRIVGTDWRKADESPRFFDFVNNNPLLKQAMNGGGLEEKAEVFKMYLETPEGMKLTGKIESSPAQPQNDTRRQAAQGLVRGKSQQSKPTGELAIDELWSSTPEYQMGS